MTDFGLTDGEVFSSLLWHIFYNSLLCEVKRQEEFCGYRLNSHFVAKTGYVEPQAGFSSFFAAGAFVDNTIWVGSSQTATQNILNVASKFFRINNISINNDKTVAISINYRVVSPFLTINGAPISIAKKGKPHQYLGIFLSMGGLSKPSFGQGTFECPKAISDKQFSYLVLAVLHPIVSYRTQFSFHYNKHTRAKKRPKTSSNNSLKTFEQIQAESKSASIVCFANAVGILGHLSLYRFYDLQGLSWRPVHSLVWFVFLPIAVYLLVVSAPVHSDSSMVKFSKCFSLLRRYRIAFVEQLRHCNDGAFDWKTFKHWKRLDLRGSIPNWFNVSVGYLGSADSSFSVHDCSVDVSFAPNVLKSTDFDLVHNCLLGLGANSLLVYTNRSLAGLGTLSVKLGTVVFFDDINMGLGVRVLGLLSSTLVELQAIALALECVPVVSKAALDACRSELGLAHPDFWNSCWVEHHYIANLVHAKRLDVSWCKVKGHSGVIGNDRTNELAGHAALSNFVLPPQLDEWFILAGGSPVLGNSRHFVHDIYWSIHHLYWGFGSGTRVVADELFTDIDWRRFSSVWHPNSYMAASFTSKQTAGLHMYFIKALHHRLPVAVHKCLYDRSYPSVVCLYCGCVKVSNHVFSCDSDFASRDWLLGDFVVK
ncbi:hypothetical protein G9A89_023838 [Geosiphon pyriformis]|nr:hypothetical protein G9A89_023838 [Geosiphon pyriformis]